MYCIYNFKNNLFLSCKKALANTEGQSRLDNPEKLATKTGYTRLKKSNQAKKHNTKCVGHHYTQTNINDVNNMRPSTNNWG